MEKESLKNEFLYTIRVFFISLFVFLSICSISCAWYFMNIDENAYWKEVYQEDYRNLGFKFFELESSYCKNEDNEYFDKYCR